MDVGFWGGAVPENLPRLRALATAGVFGFKCFQSPSGVKEFPPLPPARFEEVLRAAAAIDALVIVHNEDPQLLRQPVGPSYRDFLESRPSAAERRAVERVIAAAERTGAGRTSCTCPPPRALSRWPGRGPRGCR